MARIPTYDRQVTQVTAQQFQHTENPIGVAIKGAAQGIGAASDLLDAEQKYQDAKADEAYKLNQAPRENAITNSILQLNKENKSIREGMATAPNPEKANELLDKKFNDIINNPPQDLDSKSLEKWQQVMLAQQRSLKLQNLNWGTTAAARAGKQAARNANVTLYDMYMDDAWWSGINNVPYTNGGLALDDKGRYTDRYIPALNPGDTNIQNALHRSDLIGMASKPLTNMDIKGRPVEGIVGEIDELSGEAGDHFWSTDNQEGSKGLWDWVSGKFKKKTTPQEIGQERINSYFDDVRESIEASGLSSSEKKALTSFADAQQRAREREFTAYIQAANLEKQAMLGRLESPLDVQDWLKDYFVQQESELELNPIRENATVDELRTDDYLANLTFGNDYQSVATRYSTLPLGRVADFSEPLKIAVDTMSMPIGEWDKTELMKKYAPNGTINETQVLETLVQNSPYLTLKGAEIDAMKTENGFDEFEWVIDSISEISSMPTNTNDEQQRKQAAINHVLYQAQKEVNGGMGFSSPELNLILKDSLIGETTNSDGTVSYSPLVNSDAVIREMAKMGMFVGNIKDNQFLHKEAISIIGRGILGANAEYRRTGDMNVYKNRMRKINQDVLSAQYRGVLDIDDLQQKLDDHKPALFLYNGNPYEYIGFSGNDIFIKAGNQKQKLGD